MLSHSGQREIIALDHKSVCYFANSAVRQAPPVMVDRSQILAARTMTGVRGAMTDFGNGAEGRLLLQGLDIRRPGPEPVPRPNQHMASTRVGVKWLPTGGRGDTHGTIATRPATHASGSLVSYSGYGIPLHKPRPPPQESTTWVMSGHLSTPASFTRTPQVTPAFTHPLGASSIQPMVGREPSQSLTRKPMNHIEKDAAKACTRARRQTRTRFLSRHVLWPFSSRSPPPLSTPAAERRWILL